MFLTASHIDRNSFYALVNHENTSFMQ